ncbi:hypothetical protein BK643_23595 [Pseudomonas protegens]|uniref:DUF2441 domain-containing protein n=1 Tax=Pseudomonas protegens TaxID=380021 RepID=UPI000F470E13|nr:DUF2441 domain-containing protein [Pseudomonas protegens]ROM15527.1 hypothetical protein BK643_23595 [Pseudomonas protegens]
MQYFHIDSCYAPAGKRLLEIGQTINTSSRPFTPYYEQMRDIHHVIPVYGQKRRLKELLLSRDIDQFLSRELAKNFHGVIDTYIRLLREMEFENIRREQYASRPSRTRCIWLTDSLDEEIYWRKRLNKPNGTRIVRVEVDGILHQADGRHLSAESSSLSELRVAAQSYWGGGLRADSEREYLLEGAMTVIAVEECESPIS